MEIRRVCMDNKWGERKLLSIQRSKLTHSLSKLRGLSQPFNWMKLLRIPSFLKHSRNQMAEDGLTLSLSNLCKGYADSWENFAWWMEEISKTEKLIFIIFRSWIRLGHDLVASGLYNKFWFFYIVYFLHSSRFTVLICFTGHCCSFEISQCG